VKEAWPVNYTLRSAWMAMQSFLDIHWLISSHTPADVAVLSYLEAAPASSAPVRSFVPCPGSDGWRSRAGAHPVVVRIAISVTISGYNLRFVTRRLVSSLTHARAKLTTRTTWQERLSGIAPLRNVTFDASKWCVCVYRHA